jgi:hypothetical protein
MIFQLYGSSHYLVGNSFFCVVRYSSNYPPGHTSTRLSTCFDTLPTSLVMMLKINKTVGGDYSATGLLNLIYSGLTDFLGLVNETLFYEPLNL